MVLNYIKSQFDVAKEIINEVFEVENKSDSNMDESAISMYYLYFVYKLFRENQDL